MNRKNLFLMLLALCMLASLGAEIRGIWVLPWTTNTPEKIDSFLADAVEARQTDVFFEARYRADAMYQPNRAPDGFPNPEPQSYLLNGLEFDPLAYILLQAHKLNLRVHAWFVVFNATPVDSLRVAANYVMLNHPDWITRDKSGALMQAAAHNGYFVDPGVPEVQNHLLNVIGDLLSGYPELDGLHLDYIRYPSLQTGYHPQSIERYQAENAASPINWNEWRTQQVTGFVARARELAKALNPAIDLSAAVLADYPEALKNNAQDWKDWIGKGLLDHVYPMAYAEKDKDFFKQMDIIRSMPDPDRIVVGLRAWSNEGGALKTDDWPGGYDLQDVARRIDLVRQNGYGGVALFSYDGLRGDGVLGLLTELAYADAQIAAMYHTDFLPANPSRTKYPATVSVSTGKGVYDLDLVVPFEGKWILELRGPEDFVFYQRKRYYLRGRNQDFWNGVMDNGELIPEGQYWLSVYRAQDEFEYVLPVNLEKMTQ